MKLHLDRATEGYWIDGYGAGYVAIAGTRYTSSLILSPNRIELDWPPDRIDDVTRDHLVSLVEFEPEIALLGTGSRQRFLPADLLEPLASRGTSLEVMTTAAACRTYNILASEGRIVAAALLMIRESPPWVSTR